MENFDIDNSPFFKNRNDLKTKAKDIKATVADKLDYIINLLE